MQRSVLKLWHLAAGGALLCAGAALVIVGCVTTLSLSDIAYVRHRGASPVLLMGEHLEREMKITCLDCHPGAETKDEAGMPGRKLCLSCHGGLVGVGMFDLGGDFFDADGEPKWTITAALPDGVAFSHATHREHECAECHGDIENDDYSLADLAGRFANCRRCHEHEEPSGRCRHCHTALNKAGRPHSHASGWSRRHGWRVRDMGGLGLADRTCRGCHGRADCVRCHREESPRDHTVFWVKAGHGLAADIDRGRCGVCHTQDQCVRCHLEGAPPQCAFGTTPATCIQGGCHLAKQYGHTVLTENCLLCHK